MIVKKKLMSVPIDMYGKYDPIYESGKLTWMFTRLYVSHFTPQLLNENTIIIMKYGFFSRDDVEVTDDFINITRGLIHTEFKIGDLTDDKIRREYIKNKLRS